MMPQASAVFSESMVSTTSATAKELIFATQMTSAQADYYLRGDPVSLIITNIPSFKGGRSNPWMESDDVLALRDAHGNPIARSEVEEQYKEQSISDGLLEISVASNMTNLIMDRSRRLA